MSANTSIEWTDRTWNPVRGCSVISPGCHSCYAMKQAHRFSGAGKPYEGLTKLTKAGPQWTGKITLVEDALAEPLSWRKPQRIFVNSMSDLFHDSVPDEFIDKVFAVMALAPRHTFQILTKRARRMREYLSNPIRPFHRIHAAAAVDSNPWQWVRDKGRAITPYNLYLAVEWPLPNVWLGVSAEDQQHADERIPHLLSTPAAVRFVSAEPLLGPIDFAPWLKRGSQCDCGIRRGTDEGCEPKKKIIRCNLALSHLSLVIFGGESHQSPDKARPCAIEWIDRGVQQCQAAGVAAFVKQLGSKVVSEQRTAPPQMFDEKKLKPSMFAPNGEVWAWRAGLKHPKGGDPSEWPQAFPRELPEARS